MAEDKGMGLKGWLSGPKHRETKTEEAHKKVVALDKHRLAVLPMANISPDPRDEYFADGLTDELIATISQLPGLQVIARTSVMPYKGASKSVSEVGHELEVGSVLEGSVRKAANKIRVTTQLIEAETQAHIWASTYDRELDDVFAIQSDIANRVAKALKIKLLSNDRERLDRVPTRNTEAYILYLKGRNYVGERTLQGFKKAVEYFEEAVKRDPNYAHAYTGLSDCYHLLENWGFIHPNVAWPNQRSTPRGPSRLTTRSPRHTRPWRWLSQSWTGTGVLPKANTDAHWLSTPTM